nr:hypothetical protein P5630_05450 [Bacillus subtilis]
MNGRDVQTYGSQGQRRTTALSLKLAEIDLIHEEIGEYPILLLDDVLSELDDYRQSHLLHTIQGTVYKRLSQRQALMALITKPYVKQECSVCKMVR